MQENHNTGVGLIFTFPLSKFNSTTDTSTKHKILSESHDRLAIGCTTGAVGRNDTRQTADKEFAAQRRADLKRIRSKERAFDLLLIKGEGRRMGQIIYIISDMI